MNQEEKKRFSLKYWQLMTVFLASYDLLAIHAAYFLALWLRFDFVFSRIPPEHYGRYTHFITLYAFGSVLIFGFFRMYRGMWTLAGINEMLHIFSETAPAMLMALETGMVDFVCTDMPTAQGALNAYPDMVILDFSGTDGDFQFTEQERAENVNIGVSMMKGNTVLREAIDSVLSGMTVDDFNELMAYAISISPSEE